MPTIKQVVAPHDLSNKYFDKGENTPLSIEYKFQYSLSKLRTASNIPDVVFITDTGKQGLFQYDSTDTSSTDNGISTVVNGNKRYKKIIAAPSITSVSELQAYTNSNYAYYDGSTWEKKTGNVTSNGGLFSGTLIRVSNTVYWEREINTDEVYPEWWGAKADAGVTDNYIPISNAISYIKNLGSNQIFGNYTYHRPVLKFGYGRYDTSLGFLIDFNGFSIEGCGMINTTINILNTTNADSDLFRLGSFQINSPDVFVNPFPASRFSAKSIRLAKYNSTGNFLDTQLRKGSGIQDNNNGGVFLENVEICGFKYGFNAVSGSDFDTLINIFFNSNDVGMYFGPGSQQLNILGGIVSGNKEGMVCDGLNQGQITGVSFNDNKNGQVIWEAFTTGTRQLTSFGGTGVRFQGMISYNDCWFEKIGNDNPILKWFLISSQASEAYRDITINNPYIVIGNTLLANSSFLCFEGTGGQRIKVKNPVISGGGIQYFVKNGNTNVIIEDLRVANGYPTPTISDNNLPIIKDTYRNSISQFNFVQEEFLKSNDSNVGIRAVYGANNISYSTQIAGTWYQRLGLDIQNSRIYLGADNSGFSINAANTFSSTFISKGSFSFSTTGTSSNIGWINTSNYGTTTNWIPAGFVGEYSGSGTPNVAANISSRFTDTTNGKLYTKVGVNNTDWQQLVSLSSLGNLLINTTTDDGNKLQVTGNSKFNGNINVDANLGAINIGGTTNSTFLLSLGQTPLTNGFVFQQAGAENRAQLRGYNAGVETITLNPRGFSFFNQGNIAIGNTSDFGEKLQVTGSSIITTLNVGTRRINLSGTQSILFASGDYDGSGDSQFYVSGGLSNDIQRLRIGYNTTLDLAVLQAVRMGVGNRNISLNPGGGNVLIGTTTEAGFKLDVSGTGRFTGNLEAPKLISSKFEGTTNNTGGFGNTNSGLKLSLPSYVNTDATTSASGTVAHNINAVFGQPTFSSTNTGVINTIASNVYIAGAPIAGTNTTIQNTWALYVASGNSFFQNNITAGAITGNQFKFSGQNTGTGALTNPDVIYVPNHTNNTGALTGTIAGWYQNVIGVPTLTSSNTGVNYTNASSFYIEGTPIASTNTTIQNSHALYVNSGNSYFGGNVSLGVAGNKLKIATGTNASIGTATLVAGTVTVSTTAVTTNSIIMLSYNTSIGTLGAVIAAPTGSIVNGTSFVINSLTTANSIATSDLSSINYWIVN